MNPVRGVFALSASLGLVCFSLPVQAEVGGSVSVVPEAPARPPAAAPLLPTPLPITKHVDIGAAVALVQRVAEGQTDVRYPSSVGLGLTARIEIMRYLRGNLYVLRSSSETDPPGGVLGLSGDPGPMSVTSYSFGLRLSPTLPLGPRARTWLSVGAGWGRLEVGRFDVASAGGSFKVRERVFSFVEVPMGIGVSFDIVPNWLSVEFEAIGALHAAQRGTALRTGQTIDTAGRRTVIGPFPELAATFVQTLGLALVL